MFVKCKIFKLVQRYTSFPHYLRAVQQRSEPCTTSIGPTFAKEDEIEEEESVNVDDEEVPQEPVAGVDVKDSLL